MVRKQSWWRERYSSLPDTISILNAVPDVRSDQAHDAFTYIILAKSLLREGGYLSKHWQPGFPVMLAGMLAVVGLDFVRLKLVMVTLGLFTAALSVPFYARLGLSHAAPALALLFAATPIYFDYSHRLMSEIPFLMFSLSALVALEVLRKGTTPRSEWVAGVALTLTGALSAAVFVRGNGLALVPALAVGWLSTRGDVVRRTRTFIAVALIMTTMVFSGWTLWGSAHKFSGISDVTYSEEVQAADLSQLWKAGVF